MSDSICARCPHSRRKFKRQRFLARLFPPGVTSESRPDAVAKHEGEIVESVLRAKHLP